MNRPEDLVASYASSLGYHICPRTVIVEGTTDVEIFELAAKLERARSGKCLIDAGFTLIAAGQGDRGGVNGVVREFLTLRGMARTSLLPNGRPKYRFAALFDNDRAGRQGVKTLREIDTSVLEYRDVFRLQPVMPFPGMLDPRTVQAAFARENAPAKGLDWELEDMADEGLADDFLRNHPAAVRKTFAEGGFVHREFTNDGKARFVRHIKDYAMREDLERVVQALHSLRCLMGLAKV